MKKALVLILIIAVALLASCSKSDSKTAAQTQATTAQSTAQTQATTQATTAQTAAQTQASTAQSTAQATVQSAAAAASEAAAPQGPASAAQTTAAQAVVQATQELKPATIKVWYSISGTNGQFFESQVKAFAEKYPQIKVELTYTGSYADSATKISAAKLAGNSPDIAITSASQLYTGEDGNFSMETDVLDPEFNIDDVRPGILEYANYRGRLAAVPFSISTQVIYYNKDLAAKAGYDLEANPPKTWDEFLTVAKAIQNASTKGTYGFDTSDAKWLVKNMLYQNGNEIVRMDSEGNVTPVFADESGIEVARFWARLIDEKVMAKSQHDNAENKFLSGKLVFIAATSNRIAKWAESVQFNIGAIEMPYFKEQKVALGGSTATIMTTDPDRHAASWALLKFLLNTENQTAYALTTGYLPIRESSLDIPQVQAYMEQSDLYSTAIRQLDYSTAYVHFGEMGSMDTQLTWALDDIENGTDPKRAFQDAQEQLLADLK